MIEFWRKKALTERLGLQSGINCGFTTKDICIFSLPYFAVRARGMGLGKISNISKKLGGSVNSGASIPSEENGGTMQTAILPRFGMHRLKELLILPIVIEGFMIFYGIL